MALPSHCLFVQLLPPSVGEKLPAAAFGVVEVAVQLSRDPAAAANVEPGMS